LLGRRPQGFGPGLILEVVAMTTTTPESASSVLAPADDPLFTVGERRALVGFLSGYRSLTRDAYTLDLRQYTAWCTLHRLHLFAGTCCPSGPLKPEAWLEKGLPALEVALPVLARSRRWRNEEAVMDRVIIGVDPHKRSVSIEARDGREVLLATGRFATGSREYRAMLRYARRQWPDRMWAVEGASGVGRPVAQRLLADSERVPDMPAKLAASRLNLFAEFAEDYPAPPHSDPMLLRPS
jgi:hypothetical protein